MAQQQWHLDYREQSYRLQAMLESNAEGLILVLMDSLGQRLVTLTYKGDAIQLTEHQRHPARELWPQLLESLQFIYWPLESLQQQAAQQWLFSQDGGIRRVYFSGILAGLIEYQTPDPWQGSLLYDNKRSRFQLNIESRRLH